MRSNKHRQHLIYFSLSPNAQGGQPAKSTPVKVANPFSKNSSKSTINKTTEVRKQMYVLPYASFTAAATIPKKEPSKEPDNKEEEKKSLTPPPPPMQDMVMKVQHSWTTSI